MVDAKVSVLIPVYNAEAYLEESIGSILNQSYSNIEIIVVNDGSTDRSAELLESIKVRHPGLFLFHENNRGQSATFNTAISHATGEYIKFFDADDIMNPEHIEIQMKRIAGKKDSIASCEWGRFYDGNPHSAIFDPEPVWKDMDPINWLTTALSLDADMMGAWLWLIPRSLLDKAGGWNEQLSLNNDFEFSIRLLLASSQICFAEGAKVYYRSGTKQSLSTNLSLPQVEAAVKSTDLGCGYLLEAIESKQIMSLCANRYQVWIYRIYPDYPEIVKELETKVEALGGASSSVQGGSIFLLLSRFIGWKLSRRIQLLTYRLGYKPAHPHKV